MGNKARVAFERAYIKLPYRFQGRNVHIKIGPRSYVYMESYDNDEQHRLPFCARNH